MSAFAVFAIAGAGSFALRAAMLVLLARRPLPHSLATSIRLVGPAAIAALIIGALVGRGSSAGLPTVAASIAAFGAVRRSGRMSHALLAGFPVLWLLSALSAL